MIDWKQKLSSRKFWAMIVAVVISLLAFFNVSEDTTMKVTAFLTSIGALVAYILAESYADAHRGSNETENATLMATSMASAFITAFSANNLEGNAKLQSPDVPIGGKGVSYPIDRDRVKPGPIEKPNPKDPGYGGIPELPVEPVDPPIGIEPPPVKK